MVRLVLLTAVAATCLAGCATAPRLLERALAERDSATVTLQSICDRRAPGAVIRAERVGDTAAPPPPPQLATSGEALRYRHVRLTCNGVVLSDAYNWYLASRLTPAMNALLDGTDAPFGKVVGPLGFRRERLASRTGRDPACPVGTILSQRGRLVLADGAMLALVIECYTKAAAR